MARRRAAEDREDLRFGVVASTIINMTPRTNARSVSPSDIFPHLKPEEPVEDALDAFFGVGE